MLVRPQHPACLDPLATDLSVPKLWLPKMGLTRRGMGWLPCCCYKCELNGPPDCSTPTNGKAKWFTHSVASGVITRNNHTEECYTVWVNSTSGGVAETGSGTEADPWVNLNTPFSNTCIKNACSADVQYCRKVKVLIKGTVDYLVDGHDFNFKSNLIIEPWGASRQTIGWSDNTSAHAMRDSRAVVWKHIDFTRTNSAGGIHTCYTPYYATFDDCTFYAEASVADGYADGVSGGYAAFDGCTAMAKSLGSGWLGGGPSWAMAFSGLPASTFHDCIGTASTPDAAEVAAFVGPSSAFDGCTGTGAAGNAIVWPDSGTGHGFYNSSGSTFRTCTGTGSGVIGVGFTDNATSVFTSCVGSGTGHHATQDSFGYGFYNNTSSTFNTCDGTGAATGGACCRACGFWNNVSASFNGCSTSARVCSGCTPAECTAFTCDV